MEIERKYLISSNLSAETFGGNLQCYDIEQYYVRLGDIEERYRKKANKFFHTIKKRTDNSLKREEIESECSYLDFETNKQNIIGNLIKKQRYIYVWKNYNLEIDIYKGPLEGLRVGEVEFKTEQEAHDFIAPEFFGEEVTGDKRYSNQSLAFNGFPIKNNI